MERKLSLGIVIRGGADIIKDKSVMIEVSGLVKRFETDQGEVVAADGVSFSVEAGTFFTLLGPSGCGKSTILRCVAGLEKPEEGE